MRWQLKVMIAVLCGFAALELSQGQAQFGGGFGGMGKGKGQPNPLNLLQNPAVQKELKVTDDQTAKVNEAVWEALAKVLDGDQLKRLKQIDLQSRDFRAFSDPKVQTDLKFTAKQKENVKTILDDSDKEVKDLMEQAKSGGFAGIMEKMTSINKETKEKVQGVLSKEQKRSWNEMVGEPFEFPAFGKGGKKKD